MTQRAETTDRAPLFTPSPELPRRLPQWMWRPIRWIGLLATAALVISAFRDPKVALTAFWAGFVPLAPLLFLIAPGLWRNVCPMATLNQLPRTLGITRGLALPDAVRRVAPMISTGLFLVIVPLRRVWLDENGAALGTFFVVVLSLALVGGLVFKGKSGWCSNFCPMLPVERFYNLAPVVTVPNSHCRPCVGCTKNCYDFNPTAAHVSDLHDDDPRWVSFRTLFAGALPWFIVGFNTTAEMHGHVDAGAIAGMYLRLFLFVVAGAGTFQLITAVTGLSPFKTLLLHVGAALNLFYFYVTPVALAAFGIQNDSARFSIETAVAMITVQWVMRAWPRERAFLGSPMAPSGRAASSLLTAANGASATHVPVVFDDGPSLMAAPGSTLLTVAESNGVKLEAGCRMGMCGADPVAVLEGAENLSPIAATERATLERVGAGSACRMACVAEVHGAVRVSSDPGAAPAGDDAASPAATFDIPPDLRRFVVIGTGAAGITAAHELRKLHPAAELTVVGAEPYDFYNRMNIGKLVSESTSISKLYMLKKTWAEERNVRTLFGTTVAEIRPADQVVMTADGQELPYDRLVLATGGKATLPQVEGFGIEGTFVLRTIADGVALQQYLRNHSCRSALVIGGGLLGLEAAYEISELGIRVYVLDRNAWPLGRQLDEPAGRLVQQLMNDLGVEILANAQASRLVAGDDGRLAEVCLTDGRTLAVDAALAAAGVTPDTELAARAGLAIGRGVVVDDFMATSDPRIFAVGDVAELRGRVQGLWPSAVGTARAAATNALGGRMSHESDMPPCMLKVAAVDVFAVGVTSAPDGGYEIRLEDTATRRYRKLVVAGGEVRGAILIGYPELADLVTTAVAERRAVTGHLQALRAGDWSSLGSVPETVAGR